MRVIITGTCYPCTNGLGTISPSASVCQNRFCWSTHSSCRFDSVPLCVVTTSSVLVVTPFVQYACSHGWYGHYKLMKPVDETHSNCRSKVAAGSVVAELSLCLVSLMSMPLLLEAVSIKHWLRRCSSPHLEAREREQLDKRGVHRVIGIGAGPELLRWMLQSPVQLERRPCRCAHLEQSPGTGKHGKSAHVSLRSRHTVSMCCPSCATAVCVLQ